MDDLSRSFCMDLVNDGILEPMKRMKWKFIAAVLTIFPFWGKIGCSASRSGGFSEDSGARGESGERMVEE